MKKIISILLVTAVAAGFALPSGTVFASDTAALSVEAKEAPYDDYFIPIVADGASVSQRNEEVETIIEDGSLLVDISAFEGADVEVCVNSDCAFISGENNDITLVDDADVALVNGGRETLCSDVSITNGAAFAPLEDVAALCGLEAFETEGKTVYYKPYQTKRLIVETRGSIESVGEISRQNIGGGILLLDFETQAETASACEILSQNKNVKSVTGENVYYTTELTADNFSLNENLSWGSDYVGSPYAADFAYEYGNGDTVTVGIVDTGVDVDHPFLADRLSDALPSKIDDVNGHGTHCAGIIADNTPDNVKLLPVKGLPNQNGSGSDSDIAAAINYAVENGADIISMSLGGFSISATTVFKNAIKNAYNAGCIIVVAAGNEAVNAATCFPASSPYCITVGAVDSQGVPAYFSNYGDAVDVSAPGVAINSTYLDGGYKVLSGTSMATPFVAAACATDFSINGKQDFYVEKGRVCSSVTAFGAYNSQNKYTYGHGIISYYGLIGGNLTAPVIFSAASDSYDEPFTVSLSCATEGASIYYTVDTAESVMKEPITPSNGILYTQPIVINSGTAIRAVAYSDELLKSITTKAVYTFNDYDDEDKYVVDESGCLIEYTGNLKILSVPEYVNGIRVTEVCSDAFMGSDIVSITLPDSVTEIGMSAFESCKQLERFVAKGVTELYDSCFRFDGKLSSVQTGGLLSVGNNCFEKCSSLNESSVDLTHLEEISPYAFYSTDFSSLELPAVKYLGNYAFYDCNSLASISLPVINSVGNYAFYDCDLLESVKLENALELKSGAFKSCANLKRIDAEKLQLIGDNAFESCSSLSEITLPVAEFIGNKAFKSTALTEINLPCVRQFGYGVFTDCSLLQTLVAPQQGYVPAEMFRNCVSLQFVPQCFVSAEEVGYQAFMGCTSLESAVLDNALYVRQNAFEGCTSLAELSLSSAINVKNQKFDSQALTSLSLPLAEAVGSIESEYLTEINAPKAWYIITSDCPVLETLNVPSLVSNIDMPYSGLSVTSDGRIVIKSSDITVSSTAYNPFDVRTVPDYSVSVNGNLLEEGRDYEITFANNICKGTGYYRVDGIGSYAGCVIGNFAIDYYNISGLSVNPISNQNYTGSLVLPEVTLSDENGNVLDKGFSLSYSLNQNAGTANVAVSGLVQFTNYDISSVRGSKSASFNIVADADYVTASLEGDFVYTGSPITPKPVLILNDKVLIENEDYTLRYENNVNKGNAYIYVDFTGDYYTGSKKLGFEIAPAPLDASKLSLAASVYNYTGEEITPEIISDVYVQDRDFTVIYSDNTEYGTGVALITGKGNYSGSVRLYFDISLVNQWLCYRGEWYYFGEDGRTTVGWLKLDGKWYYFDDYGVMQVGRIKVGGTWYLFASNGVMQTGWQKTDGKWYYYASSGAMQTGWVKTGGKWYYLNSSGVMQTGWLKDGGKWYYLNSSGAMQLGWQKLGGSWYYFNSSGAMVTGWLKIGGKWYYLNSSGAMVTGTQRINGKKYKFNSSGVWLG